MHFFATIFFAIIAFVSLVSGAPIELSERDVFVPPVILPNSHSVWKVGSTQTVKWYVVSCENARVASIC